MRCLWQQKTCAQAAGAGKLEVLEFARRHHCPWDADTCSLAAYGGHFRVLVWARAHGCPWNEWTTYLAAESGNLHVLRWAREHHCPWDDNTAGPETCSLAVYSYTCVPVYTHHILLPGLATRSLFS